MARRLVRASSRNFPMRKIGNPVQSFCNRGQEPRADTKRARQRRGRRTRPLSPGPACTAPHQPHATQPVPMPPACRAPVPARAWRRCSPARTASQAPRPCGAPALHGSCLAAAARGGVELPCRAPMNQTSKCAYVSSTNVETRKQLLLDHMSIGYMRRKRPDTTILPRFARFHSCTHAYC